MSPSITKRDALLALIEHYKELLEQEIKDEENMSEPDGLIIQQNFRQLMRLSKIDLNKLETDLMIYFSENL